jgi:hypothetical protein
LTSRLALARGPVWTVGLTNGNEAGMCLGVTATVAMVGIGSVSTAYAASRGEPKAMTLALGYFTMMEALQAAGYLFVDRCDSPANQAFTLLSFIHIVFQPFFINALAMALLPSGVRLRQLR